MRDDETLLWAIGGGVLIALLGVPWLGWWLAEHLTAAPPLPGGILTTLKALMAGSATWPLQATLWTILLYAAAVTALVAWLTRGSHRRVDAAAARMPRDKGLRRYIDGQGPAVGRAITGGLPGRRRPLVRMTTEDQAVVIAGPRTGKTTSVAIPAAVAHTHGPVLVTSNKRDIADAITPLRAESGRVWIFDPQQLAGINQPDWWWNPLQLAADVRGARRLAGLWTNASRAPDAKTDAYFDAEGEELLSSLLLAAALGDEPVSAIYSWLTAPDDPTPVSILSNAPGCELMAEGLQGRQDLPDRQRAGVYGTAIKTVSWLADPTMRSWLEPDPSRTQFDPTAFATSSDTLVSLSREGEGSATPLVTALTASVLDAAEQIAARSAGGRLERPLLGVLDEAANVCRWRDLPDLYSHYGSRGILLISIFQSWAQMVEGFGQQGAEKLWSSANVRVYGGGVSDTNFLKRVSDLVGEHDVEVMSHSTSRQGGSRSRSTHRRAILDVAALAAMPPGRAIVLLSAARPVLVALQPWWEGPHAARIAAAEKIAAAGAAGASTNLEEIPT